MASDDTEITLGVGKLLGLFFCWQPSAECSFPLAIRWARAPVANKR